MRALAIVLSLAALAGMILPSVLFALDRASLGQVHLWMLIATVAWYLTAPMWMDRPKA
jgi:hypothetical protein